MPALRFNEGKPEISYLLTFPHALNGIAEVLQYGASKYELYNYKLGCSAKESVDSGLRHLLAWYSGEETDPESGISHLHHAAFNFLRLAEEMESGIGVDNRPHKVLGERHES